MRINTTRQALGDGATVVGTQIQQFRSTEVARVFGAAGADFVWIDAEHGPFDQESIQDLVRAASEAGVTPVVRVGEFAYSLVARALDSGAQGIILPRATNLDELRTALSWTRFPPDGVRGFGLSGPHTGYATAGFAEIIAHHNANTMVIAQIENAWAIEYCEEIVQLPFIDVIMIGPADLSISLGIPGQITNPAFISAVERVIAACQTYGVAPGIHLRDAVAARDWIARGMRFVSASNEHALLLDRARETMSALKSLAGRDPAAP